MRMDLVKGPLAETWGLLRSDFWTVFSTMLKVAVMALLIVAATLVAAFAAAFALAGVSVIPAIIAGAAILLAGIFLASIVGSVNYNFIDALCGKRRIDFSASMRGNAIPMLGYDAVSLLIYLAVSAPFIALIAMLALSRGLAGLNGLIAEFLIRIGLTAVSAVVSFLIQFTIFELLVSRKGLLESFGLSLRIVRRRPLETIAYSIIVWALESVIAIPFSIALVLLVFAAILAAPAFGIEAVAAIAILAAALVMVMVALTNAVSITARYKYWTRARKA